MKYIATDPGDGLEAVKNKLAEADAPASGKVLLVKLDSTSNELAFEEVSCSDKAALKSALKEDHSEESPPTLRRGPCCINPHHVVCQVELDNIRSSCDHAGKGSNTTGCPA